MQTTPSYAEKIILKQKLLPQSARYLSFSTPRIDKDGSTVYFYPYSIYQWLLEKSLNLLTLTELKKERLALDLAEFLKELQAIINLEGLALVSTTGGGIII